MSPTILRSDGYMFFFYSREFSGGTLEPPHVHVRKSGAEAKVWIDSARLCTRTASIAVTSARSVISWCDTGEVYGARGMSISESLRAKRIEVDELELRVELANGTRHAAPLSIFPILAEATPAELAKWELIGGGSGIYWPELDEHVSVFSIVYPDRTALPRKPIIEQHLARNRARRSRRAG